MGPKFTHTKRTGKKGATTSKKTTAGKSKAKSSAVTALDMDDDSGDNLDENHISKPPRPKPKPTRRVTNQEKEAEAVDTLLRMNREPTVSERVAARLFRAPLAEVMQDNDDARHQRAPAADDWDLDGDDEEIDELDDSNEEEEEVAEIEEETFNIPMTVPADGKATRTLPNITNKTTINEFWPLLSDRLRIPLPNVLKLKFTYLPSYRPKNPKPIPAMLEDQADLTNLIDDVAEHRAQYLKKKKPVPLFHVAIMYADSELPLSAAPKKGTKGSGRASASTDFDDEHAATVTSHAKILREIEKAHQCDACGPGKICAVLRDGKHFNLLPHHTATWATLCQQHRATITTVPLTELKITEGERDQQARASRRTSITTPVAGIPAPPIAAPILPTPHMDPMLGALVGNLLANKMNQTDLLASYFAGSLPSASSLASAPSKGNITPASSISAKRPAPDEPDLEVRNLPIRDWLHSLDQHPVRGRSGPIHSPLGDILSDNGFLEMSDLTQMNPDVLHQHTKIPIGMTSRLILFLKEDCGTVDGPKRIRWTI